MKTREFTYVSYEDTILQRTFVVTLHDFAERISFLNTSDKLPPHIRVINRQTFELLEPESYDDLKSFPLSDSIRGIVLGQLSTFRKEMEKHDVE